MSCCFGQVQERTFKAGADQPVPPEAGRRTGLYPAGSGSDVGLAHRHAHVDLGIDINTASRGVFQSLVGIGKVTAAQLVAGQPYRSVEDACAVSGRLTKHRARLRCGPVVEPPVPCPSPSPADPPSAAAAGNAVLIVASWNVRHLSGSRDDAALRRIASVMARFHLIAVQEVRSADVCGTLLTLLPGGTSAWDCRVSRPIGRGKRNAGKAHVHEERYAFFWQTRFVALLREPTVCSDKNDLLVREPYIVRWSFGLDVRPFNRASPFAAPYGYRARWAPGGR